MNYDKNVYIPLQSGGVIAANVYRPQAAGRYPVLLAQSPYPKDAHFSNFHPAYWKSLTTRHPQVTQGTSARHMVWEAPDPDRWLPLGYAVVHLDAPGSGRSPGKLDLLSPAEIGALCEAIEWAAAQPWSNGKVGMLGISYFAMSQWLAASRQPRGLAAIVPWEGSSDLYREFNYHGGIRSNAFSDYWWSQVVLRNQHGNPNNPLVDKDTGESLAGTATEASLVAQRAEFPAQASAHPLDDAWHRDRSAVFEKIDIPLLSAGNWGGLGLHLRGNVEGFVRSASKQKWLELHTGSHFDRFSLPEGRAVQQQFFDHFLRGEDNGGLQQPRVRCELRSSGGSEWVSGDDWPLPDTQWTRLFLDASGAGLATTPPSSTARASFQASAEGLTFSTGVLTKPMTILGPISLRLVAASSTADMDLFITLRVFKPDGQEMTFFGANDQAAPLTQGWLRASHRALDPHLSTPWRPYHRHDAVRLLAPEVPVDLNMEIWPTSAVLPAGSRLDVEISGRDFARAEPSAARSPFRGSGPFLHTAAERCQPQFDGLTTVFTGPDQPSYLLLPLIER